MSDHNPPASLMGWLGPEMAEPEFDRLKYNFIPYVVKGQKATDPPKIPVWEFAKRLNGGRHLPTLRQETGDCVAAGASQAGQYMACFEIYRQRQPELYKQWFPPFIYGASRLAPDCGRGRLGSGAGSLGSWAATAMMKYGVLFSDDPNVPQYSGNLADQWGRSPGPPKPFWDEAADNLVGSAARLTTVAEIREALCNYHMVTIASQQGFEMRAVRYKDHHVFKPKGQWAHQMCYIGWIDDPFPAGYRLNSWGETVHGPPLNGEPPGGAWNHAADMEAELRRFDCEIYAISLFDGFLAPPSFSIL